jgi:hypothetical protein
VISRSVTCQTPCLANSRSASRWRRDLVSVLSRGTGGPDVPQPMGLSADSGMIVGHCTSSGSGFENGPYFGTACSR